MYLPANFKVAAGNDARFVRLTTWAVPKGVPPLGIYVDRGQLTLQVNASKGPNSFRKAFRPWGVPAAPLRNRWIDFGMFVKWSGSGDGQVQLFVDGVQQKMNWPFGGEGEDPAAHGGVGAAAPFLAACAKAASGPSPVSATAIAHPAPASAIRRSDISKPLDRQAQRLARRANPA